MLNLVVLVGKVAKIPEVISTSKGNNMSYMLLEVERSFRNENGLIESDLYKVLLWKGISDECCDVCRVGSVIGIKGRLIADNYITEDKEYYHSTVMAEKVSFLSERIKNDPSIK